MGVPVELFNFFITAYRIFPDRGIGSVVEETTVSRVLGIEIYLTAEYCFSDHVSGAELYLVDCIETAGIEHEYDHLPEYSTLGIDF